MEKNINCYSVDSLMDSFSVDDLLDCQDSMLTCKCLNCFFAVYVSLKSSLSYCYNSLLIHFPTSPSYKVLNLHENEACHSH